MVLCEAGKSKCIVYTQSNVNAHSSLHDAMWSTFILSVIVGNKVLFVLELRSLSQNINLLSLLKCDCLHPQLSNAQEVVSAICIHQHQRETITFIVH